MTDAFTALLILVGSALMFLASLGIMRMPDLFTRMSTATKASTLGVGCILVAAAIHFGEIGAASRMLATVVFIVITTPVAAHMIARAAYVAGVPLWSGTITDELRASIGTGSRAAPQWYVKENPPTLP